MKTLLNPPPTYTSLSRAASTTMNGMMQPPLPFCGIESIDSYIGGKAFSKRLSESGDNLVGPLSTRLFNDQVPIQNLIPYLDKFAQTVQSVLPPKRIPQEVLPLEEKIITLSFHEMGHSGVIYKMSDGETDYALKIFKPRSLTKFDPTGSGGYGEMELGLLLSNYTLKDSPRFFFGNAPNWSIVEWINPEDKVEDRPGKDYLEDVCNRLGLLITDKTPENYNYPGGIRYDLGGIHPHNLLFSIAYSKPVYPVARLAYYTVLVLDKQFSALKKWLTTPRD